jgi:hypothetical protein
VKRHGSRNQRIHAKLRAMPAGLLVHACTQASRMITR